MAVQVRKEEWIALGVVLGIVVLAGGLFLAREFLRFTPSVNRAGGPAEVVGPGPSDPSEGESTGGTEEESPADAEPEGEESEEDWRAGLASEMELSEEQIEILEMVSPAGEEESAESAELRDRTLKEFFTEAQREKIEARLKRYSVEGYREELLKKGASASETSP